MVMATGIVSIAAYLLGHPSTAVVLLWLNTAFYATLWLATLLRIVWWREHFLADLQDHARSLGFLTMVAGSCVLGNQFLLITNAWVVAAGLWYTGIVLWAVLTYGILTILTVKTEKPPLARGLNGGWLVAVVAPQSLVVLGAQLAAGFQSHQGGVLLFCLLLWLGGGMLYIWIISLIFYRYTFFPMNPEDLAPPYWINMGAVAISTLAGTTLLVAAPQSSVLQQLLPFLKGLTLLFWATATWWIPMLFILGIWRHGYRRYPLRYDPLYWGAVFPLGMYTVSTWRLAAAIEVPGLFVVPRVFFVVAFAAWLATLAGLGHHLIRTRQL
jgi:tellurite resistance protein TehA-like permease